MVTRRKKFASRQNPMPESESTPTPEAAPISSYPNGATKSNPLLKKIIIGFVLVCIVLASAIVYWKFFLPADSDISNIAPDKQVKTAKVIETNTSLPDIVKISAGEDRRVVAGVLELPLSDTSEDVIVPQAKYTIKTAYGLAEVEAKKWASDARLIFIKSLGALSPTGEAEGWQIVFGSALQKTGYGVMVYADKIASQKEISAEGYGNNLPEAWYDSSEAISTLRSILPSGSVSVSVISFFYNSDSKMWQYAFATSAGVTSLNVK